MRDTIQHFCEKHLDKIKIYMDKVCAKIPPLAKCTIEGEENIEGFFLDSSK
jgi:protein melted